MNIPHTGHTPGPWRLVGHYIMASPDRCAYNIAVMDNLHCTPVEANGNLLAAAPELLQALEMLLLHTKELSAKNGLSINDTVFIQAKAAITKAGTREPSQITILDRSK